MESTCNRQDFYSILYSFCPAGSDNGYTSQELLIKKSNASTHDMDHFQWHDPVKHANFKDHISKCHCSQEPSRKFIQLWNQRSRQYSSGSVTIGLLGRPGIRRINTDVFFGIIEASSAYSESTKDMIEISNNSMDCIHSSYMKITGYTKSNS
jgi:hypothetical protein